MTSFLVFTLYGPMASWGEVAVGEMRDTETVPTRSALLGLLGAALGYRREDEGNLERLATETGTAVLVERPGKLLQDYHTAQAPPAKYAGRWATRRESMAIARTDLTTVLSWRSYRCDCVYSVGVWQRSERALPLETLREALLHPVFTPSLGRKSCVTAAPFLPDQVEVPTIDAAFTRYLAQPPVVALRKRLVTRYWPEDMGERLLATDGETAVASGLSLATVVRRHDEPTGWLRTQRGFGERAETRRFLTKEQS